MMKTCFCKRMDEDLHIDGDVGKLPWQKAEWLTLTDTITGEAAVQATQVKTLWNDRWFYVAFACNDNDIRATMQNYNDLLYEEEVVEVFIDCNREQHTYVELEVNPLNALLHYYIHNDLKGNLTSYQRVNQTIQTAVRRDDGKNYWSAELAIPMKELFQATSNPPRIGDIWAINFYRIDRPQGKEPEFSAWSPTGKPNFHIPQKFGQLIFI